MDNIKYNASISTFLLSSYSIYLFNINININFNIILYYITSIIINISI